MFNNIRISKNGNDNNNNDKARVWKIIIKECVVLENDFFLIIIISKIDQKSRKLPTTKLK